MSDLNLCQFIGRLGRDPEVRYLPNGDAVTNLSLAVGWKTKDKEGTEWVRCSAFGKLAEICGQYLSKGKQVYVSGRMSTREYEQDGVKKYSTEIRLEQMQMLGGKDGAEAPAPAPKPAASQRQPARVQQFEHDGMNSPNEVARAKTGFGDMDDRIPFDNPYKGRYGYVV